VAVGELPCTGRSRELSWAFDSRLARKFEVDWVLVFKGVKPEERTGVGWVGLTSKVDCCVGGENGLVWNSVWNVNVWNAVIRELLCCAASCWELAWTFDSGLAWKIEG
jgi:hypothetical protein